MSETVSSSLERTDRRAPLDIWREVRRVLCTLFDVFGDPSEVAARHTFTLKQHQLITPWLRAVEALMRRMLFIEAALIDVPPASSRQTSAGKMPAVRRKRERVVHDPEHPETWRVSFRCLYGPPASRRHAPHSEGFAQAGGTPAVHIAQRFRSGWPLAERMEALLRVFNDPVPYAKRLARRLRAKRALVGRFFASWDAFRDLVGWTLHDALTEPVACAARVLNTS